MPSDKPGLLIRKQLLTLLTEHGEDEVHRPVWNAAGHFVRGIAAPSN